MNAKHKKVSEIYTIIHHKLYHMCWNKQRYYYSSLYPNFAVELFELRRRINCKKIV